MSLPVAPTLPGEALLEIFVHPASLSPGRPIDPENKFGSSTHLEELGRKMVEMAYMHAMFMKWPNISAEQLQGLVTSTIYGFMEKAVRSYGWRDRVRGCPLTLMQSPAESHRIFWTYAGAVHLQHGYEVLGRWIEALTEI